MGQRCESGSIWKLLNFCGSGITLKKEAGSGSKLGSDLIYMERKAEKKSFLLLQTWFKVTVGQR